MTDPTPDGTRPLGELLREEWQRTKFACVCALCATYVSACALVLLGVLWTPVEQIAAVAAGLWTFKRLGGFS